MTIKMLVKFLWVTCLILPSLSLPHDEHEAVKEVKEGFKEYIETKVRPLYLDDALKKIQLPHFFRKNDPFKDISISDQSLCDLCVAFVELILIERTAWNFSDIAIKTEGTAICELLGIETARVCEGTVDTNADILLYIIDNNPSLDAKKVCDLVLQSRHCNSSTDNVDWQVDIPSGQSLPRPQPADVPPYIRVLHLTDMHVDPMYTSNKTTKCKEPLCCQSDQDDAGDGTESCGYWAQYANDVSENLSNEVIRFANTFEVDYIYYTGDIISHRMWNTSQESNSKTIQEFLQNLKTGFNAPVFPVLGNHESSPLNQFVSNTDGVPNNLSTKWLFDLIQKEWSEWLPDSTLDTISKGGYYTVSPRKGFRIIVINTNVAYNVNWWLLEDDHDPFGQLAWLVDTLKQAEAAGESVHILGHIPTGSQDVYKIWAREYNRIINRFANTITGQFNGHVHIDTLQVHYNISNTEQAINVAWNGASIVPFDLANPSFKIYYLNNETFNIVDIDQWTFNLTLANENGGQKPDWYKIYSFKEAFRVSSLKPQDIGNLLVTMAKNHTMLEEYHLYRFKNSDDPFVTAGCDQDCQKKYLCEFSRSVFGDTAKCDYLKKIYDENTNLN
ncbi:hypothetical protein ABEB36_003915 [Hypothenemus hampei]|uniref:Sphingomyelin phosphodiesterase n=1 Tax=Hypothenemus hampei TaxID=57062 RepID=A0ABD1F1K3_HYPHA